MTNWSAMAKGHNEWYLAASLIALGNESNARWPNRDTASDGAIGDASHQAHTSDHNPDWSAGGVVRAIDIDNNGIDVQTLLSAIIGDRRVWYVIWDRHIYSLTYNWAKRLYTGADPHTGHLHISILHSRTAENDVSRWLPTIKPPKETPLKLDNEDRAFITGEVQRFSAFNAENLRQRIDDIASAAARAVDTSLDDDITGVNAKLDALKIELGLKV